MNIDTLHKKYYSKIHRHVTGLVNQLDVDDVVQEIFLKIEKGLPYFKEESKISTWIHRITVNHCIDILRKRKAQQLYIISNVEPHNIDHAPCGCEHKDVETILINDEMNKCIKKYIQQLPDGFKEVVLLSDIEGYRNDEIVEKMGISLDLVKIRLHRGRLKLKNILTKQCCFYYTVNNELACDQK